MCFQSQFPPKSVNSVRIPNKNTFSSAEIIERRIGLCPEASSRGTFGERPLLALWGRDLLRIIRLLTKLGVKIIRLLTTFEDNLTFDRGVESGG